MDLQLIDDLCDRFEAALRRGEPVRIEEYLEEVEDEYRSKLLRELLEIEIELSGQQVSEADQSFSQSPLFRLRESLKERFPEQEEQIDTIVGRVARLRRIGDYEILEELGHGGMGVVYKARQKLLNQTVAIKVLSQTLLHDQQAVGRFRREMQLIGGLNHPNIVRALNAGETDGAHYLVMEFVDGITLQRLGDNLRKGKKSVFLSREDLSNRQTSDFMPTVRHSDVSDAYLDKVLAASDHPSVSFSSDGSAKKTNELPVFPIPAACEAIRQAALGLQHAHEFGLVHRDVKPANLMLDRRGTVKLLDLGLGKFLDECRAPSEHTSLTMAGTTIGTIDYISPEQCENAGCVDIRSDLYSLGCTFHYLLTGKAPYTGSRYDTTRKKLMAHIVGEIPNIQKLIPDLPDGLESILEKLLAKEPQERYQTPLELAEALIPYCSIESLLELVGGELPSGIHRSPGSTSRILGTSNTLQTEAIRKSRSPFITKSGRDLRKILLWPILLLGVALLLPGIALTRHYFRNPDHAREIRKQLFDRTSSAPAQTGTDPIRDDRPTTPPTAAQTQKEAVLSDLLLLPGLNGSWWFDEMPWFLPPVRELLARKIDETEDLVSLLGNDPERYYDPNVPAVQNWLWEIVNRMNGELDSTDRELISRMKSYYETFFDPVVSEKSYTEFLEFFVKNRSSDHSRENPWRAVDLHTRALLEHQLAVIRNDRELALTAMKRYEDALNRYRFEASKRKQGEQATDSADLAERQAAARSRKLEFLCLSDSARLEYLAGGNYLRALRRFDDITRERETGERLGSLFLAELRSAHGDLCSSAGQYDDSLFVRGLDMLARSPAGKRMHPLTAQLSERYAWSLLEQWKLLEAERQFASGLLIREANRRESKNRNAAIYVFHNWHGLAMTFRYRGNADRAVEEYRKTMAAIDKELEECQASSDTNRIDPPAGLRRYHAHLRQRAANTRERLADCVLYGGAASGLFSRGRMTETANLYGEAAKLYDLEGPVRTMKAKQAIVLLLLDEIDSAERILCDLDEQKRHLLGNQLRGELVRQLADALLSYCKITGESDPGTAGKSRQPLRQFLRQFTIPTNPVSAEAARKEVAELRLFCAEFLVDRDRKQNDMDQIRTDLPLLTQPIGDFMNRPESKPFLRRTADLIVRTEAKLYDLSRSAEGRAPRPLLPIVRLLQLIRFRNTGDMPSMTDIKASEVLPTLVVFFLTEDPGEGFVVFYPQDGRVGELYPLPLTRQMVKGGTARTGDAWKLDEKLVEAVRAERGAGHPVVVSWNDKAAWARSEDALLDDDWPFEEFPLHENVDEK